MSDEELTDFGLAAKFMCRDKKPRETFVTQLKEARKLAKSGGEGIRRRRPTLYGHSPFRICVFSL
jgi:hypothetical protein